MNAIDFTQELLFEKDNSGRYKHIYTIPNDQYNPLYGKEIFIPQNISKNRDVLFQALGYIGAYANNYFDDKEIHYIFIPDQTIDNLSFGIKDEVALSIEQICNDQKRRWKNPEKWKFRLEFILECEVISFLKTFPPNNELIKGLIEKYEQ